MIGNEWRRIAAGDYEREPWRIVREVHPGLPLSNQRIWHLYCNGVRVGSFDVMADAKAWADEKGRAEFHGSGSMLAADVRHAARRGRR